MKYLITLLIISFSLLYSEIQTTNEIDLPQHYINTDVQITQIDTKNNWQNFFNENGNWNITLDKFTDTPVRAVGKAIKICNGNELNGNSIEKITTDFLKKYSDVFNIDPNQFKLVSSAKANKVWYVTYHQFYKGYKVLESYIKLSVYENGNLMAFRIKAYDDININTKDVLSLDEAVSKSLINVKKNNIKLQSKKDELFILPMNYGAGYDYQLVYNYDIMDKSSFTSFGNYISAHTGDVLWRFKTTYNADSKIMTKGDIKKKNIRSEVTNEIFPYQQVIVNNDKYFTDENGELDVELKNEDIIRMGFTGKYCKIRFDNRQTTSNFKILEDDQDVIINWTDENSNKYERFAYYHLNFIRNWIKDIDPGLSVMDKPVGINFFSYMPGFDKPNAVSYSMGDSIGFIMYEDNNVRYSESPSVLYHEYGHGINNRLYYDLGSDYGMNNSALHEAMADITSAFILDECRMGAYAFLDDTSRVVRNIDNENKYPDDMTGESHNDGLVLGGALWDLKEATSLDYIKRITHFTRYGTPDGYPTELCYYQYLIELLTVDDDDGDLSNGTPNMGKILTAFNKHNIGMNIPVSRSFVHEQIPNSEEFDRTFNATFAFEDMGILNSKIDSAFIIYTTNNFETINRVKALADETSGENAFIATIPELDKPSFVRYKFEYYISNNVNALYAPIDSGETYKFFAGYKVLYKDSFNSPNSWTIGAKDDFGYLGEFEITKPEKVSLGNENEIIFQPGEDHSINDETCLVTDGKSYDSFYEGMLFNGQTSAISEIYDLEKQKNVIISFWMWTSILISIDKEYDDARFLYGSNDGGITWNLLSVIDSKSVRDWEEFFLLLPQELCTSEFRLKFVAYASLKSDIHMDWLIDDMSILVPVDGVSVNEVKSIIDIYPNPADDYIEISANKTSESSIIEIFDVLGNKVANKSLSVSSEFGTTNRVDISQLQPGVYFVKIGDKVEKFVKM